jgi:hypothetical protein
MRLTCMAISCQPIACADAITSILALIRPITLLLLTINANLELYGRSVPNECLFGVRMQLSDLTQAHSFSTNQLKWPTYLLTFCYRVQDFNTEPWSVTQGCNTNSPNRKRKFQPFLSYFLFYYKIWNNPLGNSFNSDFHFTKENHQNYGCCTTKNVL